MFLAAVKEMGRDIQLMQQPANSPNLNALDLGFFLAQFSPSQFAMHLTLSRN
jgi:hypothetical protein